ncbi:MAG TPA: hypothetical protein VFQ66_08815, partial [Candidatus Limnocylindria bacterium]|nr:hypothetical protein [Candidatus Limnocylindria bacterium]
MVLSVSPVQSPQLRGDRLDPLAAHELGEIDPMRADVGDRARRTAARFLDAPVRVGREEQPILQERATRG